MAFFLRAALEQQMLKYLEGVARGVPRNPKNGRGFLKLILFREKEIEFRFFKNRNFGKRNVPGAFSEHHRGLPG